MADRPAGLPRIDPPPRLDDLVADLYPLIIHDPQGEPVTTPDPFGRDGGDIDEATGEPVAHDAFTTVEGLSRYVDQLRDAIDQHAGRRARDNERHTRQITELGHQLSNLADSTARIDRRVAELEAKAAVEPDDDLDGFLATYPGNDSVASAGFSMLEAYRQGQRDAYVHCNALVRNADSSAAIIKTLRDLATTETP